MNKTNISRQAGTHWIYQALRLLSRDDEAPKGDLQLVEMFPPVSFCPPVAQNPDVVPGVCIGPGRIIEQLAENLKQCGAMCNLAQNHSVGTADVPPPTQHGGGPLWRQNDSLDALLEREAAAGDFRLLVTHAPASWLPIKPGTQFTIRLLALQVQKYKY